MRPRHGIALALLTVAMSTPHGATASTDCRGAPVADPAHRLHPCADRPNCVSTEHADPARRLAAPSAVDLPRLRAAILAEPRSTVIAEGEGWLWIHFRSRLFGFVDEAHFILRPDGTLAARSGACSGYSDFGVNRRRLERIFARLDGG